MDAFRFACILTISVAALSLPASGIAAYAEDPEYVDIGALLPKGGGLADHGDRFEAASIYAVERFNHYLEDAGEDWRLRLQAQNILDTASDTTTAANAARTLHERGIEYMTGPPRSNTLHEIKNTMSDEGWSALLVSCCSTATDLADADTIFRLTPADDKQGPHIARMLHNEGKQVLIPVWVDDPYGNGLVRNTASHFEGLGHHAVYGPQHDPGAAPGDATMAYSECVDDHNTCDGQFAGLASGLNDTAVRHILDYGADRVAIMYVGFDAPAFARHAMQYPALGMVQWVGADASTLAPSLTNPENYDVRGFFKDTNFRATIYAPPTSGQAHQDVTAHLQGLFGDVELLSFDYSSYDAVWAIGLAIQQARTDGVNMTVQAVADRLPPAIANNTNLALGIITLDDHGDLEGTSYDVFGIEPSADGPPSWVKIGTFSDYNHYTPIHEDPVIVVDLGLLVNPRMEYGSYFFDDVLGVAMHLGVADWNAANDGHMIRAHTIDVADGALAAVNTLHHGMYDGFYHPRLDAVIDNAMATYDGVSFDIDSMYNGTDLYPFVIAANGTIIHHGLGGEEAGSSNMDDVPGSDREHAQVFSLFAEEDGPDELWWEYTDGDSVKRTLLVYHAESRTVVGAGYNPVLGDDDDHYETFHRLIAEEVEYANDIGGDPRVLAGYDIDSATTPFDVFTFRTDANVSATIEYTTAEEIAADIRETGHTWLSYRFYNDHTGIVEPKRSLVELHDIGDTEYFVGVGYHTPRPMTYFVGPITSGNLADIREHFNDNDLVAVSPSSTALSLAINDNIFRLNPSDASNMVPLIHQIRDNGITHVVIVQRDDVWGSDVTQNIMQYEDVVFYPPSQYDLLIPVNNTDSFNFTALYHRMNAAIDNATARAGGDAGRVGVLFATFDTGFVRLAEAGASGDAVQTGVQFYGTNGIAAIDTITASTPAARLADTTDLVATRYTIPDNPINTEVRETAEQLGIEYTAYYYAGAYDAVGLLADAISANDPSADGTGSADVIYALSSTTGYLGATDDTDGLSLDENGDAKSSIHDYSIFEVAGTGTGTYAWQVRSQGCSAAVESSEITYEATGTTSHIMTQTITNDGYDIIDSLEVFGADYADDAVLTSLLELQDPNSAIFERLLGKRTLANDLQPGEPVTISYRMNLEHAGASSPMSEITQKVSYRIFCTGGTP